MSVSEEILMAYADGQLDREACAQVEAAMAADPLLARKVSQHRALRARLRAAFDHVLEEPVPERLIACVHTAPTLQRRSNVIPFRRRRAPMRLPWAQAGILAASLFLGIVVGQMLPRSDRKETVTGASDGSVLAVGNLAQALSTQSAADQTTAEPVQIGETFRSRSGHYCRTFALRSLLTGVACHEGEGWRVRVLAEEAAQPADDHPAQPTQILEAVQDQLVMEPLDAQEEAAARARGWNP